MQVLVVENEEADREVISRFLDRIGVKVVCVSTLREAMVFDATHDFDLILLDGILPDADEVETSYFSKVARSSVVIITGNPSLFERFKNDKGMRLFDKVNLPQTLEEVARFVREKLT